MASKINPKGILKSNSRSKGPNPKGINPGGINSKSVTKPVVSKPVVSTTTSIYKGRAGVTKGNQAAVKAAKLAKLGKAGKVGAVAGTIAAIGYGAKKLYDYATGNDNKPKKDSGKKPEKTNTLIKTPSLKDELKKRGVDTKPVKDNPKTNWLDTAKKGNTLKYVPDNKKSKKDDSKKGSFPRELDKLVRAADGNQPGDGSSLKFTGDRSKVAGKDKWGRSPSSKWYGFNPESKKYEAPTMVKGNNKKSDTKVETKKPATTPKTTTPKASTPAVKKAEPVGTLAPKSTQTIASKSLEEAKTVTPAKTTTPAATTTSTESSTSTTTSSPKVTGMQPRPTFINRVRGVVNESRERRAGRAASRGNEERSERLKEKISETEKKMMMKKGGSVKKSKKK